MGVFCLSPNSYSVIQYLSITEELKSLFSIETISDVQKVETQKIVEIVE